MDIIGETIIKWIITFVLGAIFGYISTRLKKERIKNEKEKETNIALKTAVQSLLRDRLIEKYRYFKTKKEMTILDKENIDHLYKEYKNLGGNGTIAELYEDLEDINIKIIKE